MHLLLFFLLLAAAGESMREGSPAALLWAGPCLLISALAIAWGAESAQFFIAQGFALAILAWLQTLPEFAVEAVIAWHQQTHFLLANLTGALRMLTGLGWPMIYWAAATAHRKRGTTPLRQIELEGNQCVNVVGLLAPLLYMSFVLWKGSLTVYDGGVLIAIYAVYLLILMKMPPEEAEGIDDLERIPRYIVLSPKPRRILLITLCFVAGGGLIWFTAEPFLASLLGLATLIGIPSFVFIQWVAPIVSEFPELASTFYFARTVTGAPMALMNMVSSNVNQWTLLTAMLPILYSFSRGSASSLVFDDRQKLELLMTLAQALVGMLFLINMELAWWEASFLFILWVVQFVLSAVVPDDKGVASLWTNVHWYITLIYFAWAAWELLRLALGHRKPVAFTQFARVWREHLK
jgi:cation:H+ antiporter